MNAIRFGEVCCRECAEIVCDDDCIYAYIRLLGGEFIPEYMQEPIQ